MRFRKLRITWTAICGMAFILFVVLWVRSYSQFDCVRLMKRQLFILSRGNFCHVKEFRFVSNLPLSSYGSHASPILWIETYDSRYVEIERQINTAVIPMWSMTAASALLAFMPWLPQRFSLRTLLIATTLVAVVLGLIVWLSQYQRLSIGKAAAKRRDSLVTFAKY
jgi:hypothetical protein